MLRSTTATDRPGGYVAIFHTGDESRPYDVELTSVGFSSATTAVDVREGVNTAASGLVDVDFERGRIALTLPARGCVLRSFR